MAKALFSFKETSWFTKRVTELLSDDEYSKLQWRLMEYPDAGDVIKESGGIRKLRVAAKGKGTRGGARVIYYFAMRDDMIFMLDIYSKSELEDLSIDQIRDLKSLVGKWLEK